MMEILRSESNLHAYESFIAQQSTLSIPRASFLTEHSAIMASLVSSESVIYDLSVAASLIPVHLLKICIMALKHSHCLSSLVHMEMHLVYVSIYVFV